MQLDNNSDINNISDNMKFSSGDNDVKLIPLDTTFHTIDYWSVLYLIIIQILLYNQQYAFNVCTTYTVAN